MKLTLEGASLVTFRKLEAVGLRCDGVEITSAELATLLAENYREAGHNYLNLSDERSRNLVVSGQRIPVTVKDYPNDHIP